MRNLSRTLLLSHILKTSTLENEDTFQDMFRKSFVWKEIMYLMFKAVWRNPRFKFTVKAPLSWCLAWGMYLHFSIFSGVENFFGHFLLFILVFSPQCSQFVFRSCKFRLHLTRVHCCSHLCQVHSPHGYLFFANVKIFPLTSFLAQHFKNPFLSGQHPSRRGV